LLTPVADSGSGGGRGVERKKGEKGSLGWGVQALIFSTISTAAKKSLNNN